MSPYHQSLKGRLKDAPLKFIMALQRKEYELDVFFLLNSILFKGACHFLGIIKRRLLRSRKSPSHHGRISQSFEFISRIRAVQKVHSTQLDQSNLFHATVSGSLQPEASYLGSDISFATMILPPQKTSSVDVFVLEKTIKSLQQNQDSGWSFCYFFCGVQGQLTTV